MSPLDEGLVVGMAKVEPGPVVYRRRGGVWTLDRALRAQLGARSRSRRRPVLRELTVRAMIAQEVQRWDAEEVRRAAAASGLYDEPAVRPRPNAPTRAAVTNARRIARAARRDFVEARESELLAEVMAERRRSADLMKSPMVASASKMTSATQRAAILEEMRRSRESMERMSAVHAELRAGVR
ncbi:hypothetical protein ACFUEJ_14950 [Gordonia sp. NPDC057258]|uniref:hypothetical protein n=1 Tax=unclassified Gordonia (in: high G+C Gram-positive bacteria) TaxID=2657482 RepID=UPI00362FAE1D